MICTENLYKKNKTIPVHLHSILSVITTTTIPFCYCVVSNDGNCFKLEFKLFELITSPLVPFVLQNKRTRSLNYGKVEGRTTHKGITHYPNFNWFFFYLPRWPSIQEDVNFDNIRKQRQIIPTILNTSPVH